MEEFCVKGVFKSSAKFTRKQLFCKLSFLIKLQTYCRNRYFPMNFAILLSIPKFLKTYFFIQNLQTAASVSSLYNFYILLPYTAKNTVISPNFLVWNALYFLVCTASAQFRVYFPSKTPEKLLLDPGWINPLMGIQEYFSKCFF